MAIGSTEWRGETSWGDHFSYLSCSAAVYIPIVFWLLHLTVWNWVWRLHVCWDPPFLQLIFLHCLQWRGNVAPNSSQSWGCVFVHEMRGQIFPLCLMGAMATKKDLAILSFCRSLCCLINGESAGGRPPSLLIYLPLTSLISLLPPYPPGQIHSNALKSSLLSFCAPSPLPPFTSPFTPPFVAVPHISLLLFLTPSCFSCPFTVFVPTLIPSFYLILFLFVFQSGSRLMRLYLRGSNKCGCCVNAGTQQEYRRQKSTFALSEVREERYKSKVKR